METTETSINRWVDKEDVVHVYSGMLLSRKKQQNNAICSIMNEIRDYHPKRSQKDKDKYHTVSHLNVEYKYYTN